MNFRVLCAGSMLLSAAAFPAAATVHVFACEPEWGALTEEIGGEQVEVFVATTARQDPHRIEARPSLIARMRRADLAVCTGSELEVGWLPLLQRQSGNHKVQPGAPGYFAAAEVVTRLDTHEHVDRSMGDIHGGGNPHVHLDPKRLADIAKALADRLAALDTASAAYYAARYRDFATRWREAIGRWESQAQPLRGMRAVTHHQDWRYLFEWLGIKQVASLEPKPGVPPSASYLAQLKTQLEKDPPRIVVRAEYQEARPSQWLAERLRIRAVSLPYTVGGDPAASDLFKLYDITLAKLLGAAQ